MHAWSDDNADPQPGEFGALLQGAFIIASAAAAQAHPLKASAADWHTGRITPAGAPHGRLSTSTRALRAQPAVVPTIE
jgi:hypothetical protein